MAGMWLVKVSPSAWVPAVRERDDYAAVQKELGCQRVDTRFTAYAFRGRYDAPDRIQGPPKPSRARGRPQSVAAKATSPTQIRKTAKFGHSSPCRPAQRSPTKWLACGIPHSCDPLTVLGLPRGWEPPWRAESPQAAKRSRAVRRKP